MERPTLRQLEYFVAVAEERHFGHAAARCFVSQPALSAQIRLLETQLGLRLFERGRGGVLPTPAAEALLPRARAALAATDEWCAAALELVDPFAGDLRLGVIPTVAPYLLPEALPTLRRELPKLRLWLREDTTARLVEECRAGRLDLLLLALEADLGGLKTESLARDPFWLLLPDSHPLARRKKVTLADLEGHDVLLLEDGHCLADQVLTLCEADANTEFGDFRAGSLATLVQMVAGGLGVTLLPALALHREVRRRDRVRTVPFRGAAPGRTLALAFRDTTPRRALFDRVAEILRQRLPQGVEAVNQPRASGRRTSGRPPAARPGSGASR